MHPLRLYIAARTESARIIIEELTSKLGARYTKKNKAKEIWKDEAVASPLRVVHIERLVMSSRPQFSDFSSLGLLWDWSCYKSFC